MVYYALVDHFFIVENKVPKYAYGAEVTAGLREDYYSTYYNGSKEEYDKYRNGQIMVFNVSYIDAKASTVLSLIIFILMPVFVLVLIYLVLKFLINIMRKHNIKSNLKLSNINSNVKRRLKWFY